MLESWLAISTTAAAMHASPPQLDHWLTRHRVPIALAGVFLAWFSFDATVLCLTTSKTGEERPWLYMLGLGAMAFQPMVVGAWNTLAKGSILSRLPIVLPCLMLLFLTPVFNSSILADVKSFDFIVTVAGGFALFFITMLMFPLVLWFFRLRIESKTNHELTGPASWRFSVKRMLVLTSIFGVMFAMISQLRFPPNAPPGFLGPYFILVIMVLYIIPMCLAALLPILAVPLLILYRGPRGRVVPRAFALWFVACVVMLIIVVAMDPEPFPESAGILFCAQAGACLIGILSALPLRLAGIELVKTEPGSAESVLQESQEPI
jgi:hypothetical protein